VETFWVCKTVAGCDSLAQTTHFPRSAKGAKDGSLQDFQSPGRTGSRLSPRRCQGVGRSFVRSEGASLGTKLTALEDVVLAVRQVLSEQLLHEALPRQANTVEQRPAPFRNCAQCGKEVDADDPDPRLLATRAGEAEWLEPATYCHRCRRSFFPQGKSLGIDRTELSPGLQRQLASAATRNSSFENASQAVAELLDLQVGAKQIERLTAGQLPHGIQGGHLVHVETVGGIQGQVSFWKATWKEKAWCQEAQWDSRRGWRRRR